MVTGTKKDIEDLEKVQLNLGRRLLGVSDKAPWEGVLIELNWKRMEDIIMEKRLLFFNYVISLLEDRSAKKLLTNIIRSQGREQTKWYKQVIKELAELL